MAKSRSVICDTNIVIDLFKGNDLIVDECVEIGINNLCISSITSAELYYGALNKREIPKIENHIGRFTNLPINETITSIFISLMRDYCLSHRPYIVDLLIAATALHYQMEVFTLNRKDFYFISELKLYKK